MTCPDKSQDIPGILAKYHHSCGDPRTELSLEEARRIVSWFEAKYLPTVDRFTLSAYKSVVVRTDPISRSSHKTIKRLQSIGAVAVSVGLTSLIIGIALLVYRLIVR